MQRIKSQIRSLDRANERDYIEIGKKIYEKFKSGEVADLEYISLCESIEKREEEAKRASAFCLWAAIGFGIFVTIVLLVFRTPILKLLGTDAATFEYAGEYYTWIAVGAASIILGLVPSNILRTEGLAMQAMAGSILGSIVNIILDLVLVLGFKMGVLGVAVAIWFR